MMNRKILFALLLFFFGINISCMDKNRLSYNSPYDLSMPDFGMDVYTFFYEAENTNVFGEEGAIKPFIRGASIDIYIDTAYHYWSDLSANEAALVDRTDTIGISYDMMGYMPQKTIAVYENMRFPKMGMITDLDGHLMAVYVSDGDLEQAEEVIGKKRNNKTFSESKAYGDKKYYTWEENGIVFKISLIPDDLNRRRPLEKVDDKGNIIDPGIIDMEIVPYKVFMYVIKKEYAESVVNKSVRSDLMHCR